ncbi:tyrosine-protein kinase family protein [Mesorhizobium sp. AaZ16]|uniref:tyrosine-protein kinase family protein n=1 Tax=Mesorhizobium sp. AaZ16 TaxID=3402289 RepID=UPI00374EBF55
MTHVDLRHIEDVVIAISSAEKRIIGLTSAECDNLVGSVAWGAAEFLARSGRSVLLIDLQQVVRDDQGAACTLSDMLADRNITHKKQGLDVITIMPNPESRYAFADTAQLRTILEGFLGAYQFILLELGPVLAVSPAKLNPLPLGGACDYLLLTCPRGSTKRSQLRSVIDKLKAARCVIGGVILNEDRYSSMGVEVAWIASWLLWPMPRLRRRVQNWAVNSELLN